MKDSLQEIKDKDLYVGIHNFDDQKYILVTNTKMQFRVIVNKFAPDEEIDTFVLNYKGSLDTIIKNIGKEQGKNIKILAFQTQKQQLEWFVKSIKYDI